MLKTAGLLHNFVEICSGFFNEYKVKKNCLFEIETFFNIINIFTVMFLNYLIIPIPAE